LGKTKEKLVKATHYSALMSLSSLQLVFKKLQENLKIYTEREAESTDEVYQGVGN